MVKVTSLLVKAGSGFGFSFGVRAWTDIEIKGMYRLKLVSSIAKSHFVAFRGTNSPQRSLVTNTLRYPLIQEASRKSRLLHSRRKASCGLVVQWWA